MISKVEGAYRINISNGREVQFTLERFPGDCGTYILRNGYIKKRHGGLEKTNKSLTKDDKALISGLINALFYDPAPNENHKLISGYHVDTGWYATKEIVHSFPVKSRKYMKSLAAHDKTEFRYSVILLDKKRNKDFNCDYVKGSTKLKVENGKRQ